MNGLKDYALALYGREGVSAACLLLQERTGLDVNLLLFAAWMGAHRGYPLDEQEVLQARGKVADWHAEIVRPLRAVRRRLKTGPLPAPSQATAQLREKLQGLEISAELIELEELSALGQTLPAKPRAGTPRDMATAGMTRVVAIAAKRDLDTEEEAAVAFIAHAATRNEPGETHP